MPHQIVQPPPRQPASAAARPENVPQIRPVVVLQVGLYRLRVVLEERAEACDSGGVMP